MSTSALLPPFTSTRRRRSCSYSTACSLVSVPCPHRSAGAQLVHALCGQPSAQQVAELLQVTFLSTLGPITCWGAGSRASCWLPRSCLELTRKLPQTSFERLVLALSIASCCLSGMRASSARSRRLMCSCSKPKVRLPVRALKSPFGNPNWLSTTCWEVFPCSFTHQRRPQNCQFSCPAGHTRRSAGPKSPGLCLHAVLACNAQRTDVFHHVFQKRTESYLLAAIMYADALCPNICHTPKLLHAARLIT